MITKIQTIAILISALIMTAHAENSYHDTITAARSQEREEQWTQAAKTYLSAVNLAKNDAQKANALLWAANNQLREKKYEAVTQTCRAVLKLSGTAPHQKALARYRIGTMLSRDRQFVASIGELKKVLEIKRAPDNIRIEAELGIARAFYALNSYKEALTAYDNVQKYKKLTPWQHFCVLIGSGKCLYEQKKYDEAVRVFEKAALLDKISSGCQSQAQGQLAEIASVFRRDKDYDKAIKVYQKLLAQDSLGPDRRANYNILIGESEYGQEHYKEAIAFFTSAMNTNKAASTYRIRAQIRIGDAWHNMERYSEAITAYENALKLEGDKEGVQTADIHLKLGRSNFAKKRYSRAKKEFQQVMHTEDAAKYQKESAQRYLRRIRHR